MIKEVDVVLKRQHGKHKHGETKMFVFGDSYVDTGNWPKSMSSSWKEPYGFTYPGSPSGRFSDGLVLTDFIGMYVVCVTNVCIRLDCLSALYLWSVGLFRTLLM